jgi:hypothetical protein
VPDTRDFNYPLFIDFNEKWYVEGCQALIQNATFTLATDAAIFNLLVFLREFPDDQGFKNVRSLEFTDLSLFERGTFSSNAAKLLRRCPNLNNLTLIINLNDLLWTYQRGVQELDILAMTKKYDFAAITQLSALYTVNLVLKPFMALEKKLAAMEFDRKLAEVDERKVKVAGVESFWALKDWLEGLAFEHLTLIEVNCPGVEIR